MKKIVKFVVLLLAGVVMVAAGLAVYVAATFDPNVYKLQIVQAVKDRTQRTLKLEGDIKLAFFPGVSATLGKVSVSERASDSEFAGMDDFRTSLKLVPLLSKRVVINTVEIRNLRVNLVRHKDGSTNVDDLIGRDQTIPAEEIGLPVSGVEIDQVAIDNATIALADQMQGASYDLSKLNLRTGRIANGVPSRMDVSFTVRSDNPRLDLEAAFKTTFTFDFDRQHFVLDGLIVSAKGYAAGISGLVANAKGNVDARPADQAFVMTKLVIAATGKQGAGDLNFKLDMPMLNVGGNKVQGENIAFDARLNEGKSRMAVKFDIPAIAGDSQAFRASEFMASVEVQQSGATIKANMTTPLTGSMDAERIELAKLAATVNVNNPKLLKHSLDAVITGTAQVDFARKHADLTFVTKLGDSTISGKAGLTRFSPPFYTFDVDIDQFDADLYLSKPDPKQKQPQQPFDLSALKGLSAGGSLKIGTLKMDNVTASNVRFEIKAANDDAAASPGAPLKPTPDGATAIKRPDGARKGKTRNEVKDELKGVSER